MMSGMAGTVMTGMALGAGSEVGHMAVKSMMGGGSGNGGQAQEGGQQQQQMAPQQQMEGQQQQYQQAQQDPCAQYNMNFVSCLKSSESNIGLCQDYMNMLQQCQKDSSMGQNFQ